MAKMAQLAAELDEAVAVYELRRADLFNTTPRSAAARRALESLAEAAEELHRVERALGIPIGTTREERGLA